MISIKTAIPSFCNTFLFSPLELTFFFWPWKHQAYPCFGNWIFSFFLLEQSSSRAHVSRLWLHKGITWGIMKDYWCLGPGLWDSDLTDLNATWELILKKKRKVIKNSKTLQVLLCVEKLETHWLRSSAQ